MLTIGDDLLIPLSKTESNSFIPYELHIVSEGDTLWSISSLYNLDINDIARMNNIDPDSLLQLGQQLSIGNKNIHRNMESKKRTILYSVKQGDSLYKISELFDVSIKSIKDINEFRDSFSRFGFSDKHSLLKAIFNGLLTVRVMFEKLLPNLTTVPWYVLSSNNTFDPFPKTNILPLDA